MLKIAILICYYGPFPWYFRFFLHSCKFNNTIDFIIITDTHIELELPRNVRIIIEPFSKLSAQVGQALGFDVKIKTPYKLCDFKPAYGLIFKSLLKGYDFWGQGDMDVIYGDIRAFITNEMLKKFDFISVRHDYTSGCFALYRNTVFINNIFKVSKDYQKVFTSAKHFCFDECNFAHDQLAEGKSIFEVATNIESFTHVIRSLEKIKRIRAYFDFILLEGTPGRVNFDHGRIIYKRRFEAILYHLVYFKRVFNPKRMPKEIPNKYCISPTRIYLLSNPRKTQPITLKK